MRIFTSWKLFRPKKKQKPIKTKYQIISLNDFMVGIVRPFARYVRRASIMGATEFIAILDCFYLFFTRFSAGASRIESTQFEVIYLQVVRASPHNANLDSNKTALSLTALARIDACNACSLYSLQSIDLIRVLIQCCWNSTHCGYQVKNLKPTEWFFVRLQWKRRD